MSNPDNPPLDDSPWPTVAVAVAILHQDGKFLMQLRDNVPQILYPNCWGFFGGHIEPGEQPVTGLLRELGEEIQYHPTPPPELFCTTQEIRQGKLIIRHVLSGPLLVPLDRLVLGEGADLKLVSPEDVMLGQSYSSATQAHHSLGQAHRQLLLDFLENYPEWFRTP